MQVTCIRELVDVRAGQQVRQTPEIYLINHVNKAAASAWSVQLKK